MARSFPSSDEQVEDPTGDLTRDELFEVLGNDRRRCILQVLLSRDETVSVDELVTEIASWENDKGADDVTSDERKRVYTALQQTHLPALEQKGILAYDREESLVEPDASLTDINVYLRVVDTRAVPYSVLYLLLSVVGAAVLGASIAGVSELSVVSQTVLTTAIVGCFGALSLAHLISTRRRLLNPASLVSDFDADTYESHAYANPGIHPSSLPRAVPGVLVGGLAAGAVMGAVLHFVMFMMPLIGSLYGYPTVAGGWAVHIGHSVAFAGVFAVLIWLPPLRPYVRTPGEAAAVGATYGVVLWAVAQGYVLPRMTTAVLDLWRGVLYLPLDGLAAHILYGIALGAVYGAVSRRLS